VNMNLAWLAAPGTNSAQPSADFTGNKTEAHWLPDAADRSVRR